MISLTFVFYLFVVLLAIIGAMRGWAKELLVSISTLLAIFIIQVLESYIGVYQNMIVTDPAFRFHMRSLIILAMAFFGYQTHHFKVFEAGARREKLRDAVLGVVVGGFNGYMVIGSIWFFLKDLGYEAFPKVLMQPDPNSALAIQADNLIKLMPPAYLMQTPQILIAIAIAFAFILIVYI